MKTTTKILATIILLLIYIQLSAQVTGNVKLIDTNLDTMSDHSGVMVIFRGISAPAATDTVITDNTGYFADTLLSGSYEVTIKKTSFTFLRFTAFYSSSSPTVIPAKVLYQLPTPIPLSQTNGTLLPNSSYEVGGGFTFIIPAGDTLVVTEGTWLNLKDRDLRIKGCLILQGTPTNPVFLFNADTISGGLGIEYGNIAIDSGGSLIADHARLHYLIGGGPKCYIHIENSSSKNIIPFFFDKQFTNGGPIVDPHSHITIGNSLMEVISCDVSFLIEAENFSHVRAYCSRLSWGQWFYTGSTMDYQENFIKDAEIGFFAGADSGLIANNYFNEGSKIYVQNTQPTPAPKVIIKNNTFDSYRNIFTKVELDGSCDVKLLNNLNLYVTSPNFYGGAVITEAKYNVLHSNVLAPISISTPQGALINPAAAFTDTTDIFHNRYIPSLSIFPDTISIFHVGLDSLWINKGDPTFTDADGSRSDIGAYRDTINCTNPAVPILKPDSVIPVVTIIDSVYPGDANYNGIADNYDLLPIGVKYNATGPVRPSALPIWIGQYCDPWNDSLASNVNIKHTDCNGDGTINYTDVNAIYQNYGLTHIVLKAPPFGQGLWLQFPSDSIFEGDTIEIKVMLGTNSQPVNNIYGMAFSVTYDSVFIKPGSAIMNFQQCWLGTDSLDMISFFKELPAVSRYDIALSRTDMQTISGDGQIGTLVVVINDDIQAKDPMTLTTQMDFSGIYAIDEQETTLNIGADAEGFNVEIGRDTTGTFVENTSVYTSVALYPNPANEVLTINYSGTVEAQCALYNCNGAESSIFTIQKGSNHINLNTLPNGLYLLKTDTGKEILRHKIIINH